MPAVKRKRPVDDDIEKREHTTRLDLASGSRCAPVRRSTRHTLAAPAPGRRPGPRPKQADTAPPDAAITLPRRRGRPPRNPHANTAAASTVAIEEIREDHSDNHNNNNHNNHNNNNNHNNDNDNNNDDDDDDDDDDEDNGETEEDDQVVPVPLVAGKPKRLLRVLPGKENIPVHPPLNPRLKPGRLPRQHAPSGSDAQHLRTRSSRSDHAPPPAAGRVPLVSMPSSETTPAPATAIDQQELRFSTQPKSSSRSTLIAAKQRSPTPTLDAPPALGGGMPDDMSGRLGDAEGSDRTIDTVVLGKVCFRTWYTSFYGKEVLDDIAGTGTTRANKGAKHASNNQVSGVASRTDDAKGEDGEARTQGRRDRDHQPVLDRLYVCPCCFKYSKEPLAWSGHVRFCEARRFVPGRKVYVHPKGRRCGRRPEWSRPDESSKPLKRAGGPARVTEDVFEDEGEWSIWEVDGEEEVLFCQNLSLFAKLFLDNKSVFFDVTGFNYFLLVYTPPASRAPPQIVGFFSKEKISWDNNNLACILVFPPWQRKGLGALLMGVSYEISRREGVLGGPEKPISDLGKKGYKRYWAGEICRWLLGLDLERRGEQVEAGEGGATNEMDEAKEGERGWEGEGEGENTSGRDGLVISVDECSRATWISPEDCLHVLREVAVVEEDPTLDTRAEHGGGSSGAGDDDEEEGERSGVGQEDKHGEDGEEDQDGRRRDSGRVRISKQAVRAWVEANHISMEKACDPDGFVEGYAVREGVAEEEDS